MKLLGRIGAKYQDFTANEKRIFNLMSEDVKRFALQSIGEVASRLNISKTTLMRFAKTCGFTGYTDFKRALQKEVLLDVSPARKMDEVISSDFSLSTKRLCEQELDNINTTFEALDEKELAAVAQKILAAGEVYTLSWGISGSIADIFALRMKLMGVRCTTLKRTHGTLMEECALLKEGDLVLVFEIPPYNTEMIETVSQLKEKGCTIIVVTDTPRCPLTEFSDLVFFCTTNAMFFGNSLTGPLFWVNLISSLVIYKRKDEVMGVLEERQKMFDDERYYHQ